MAVYQVILIGAPKAEYDMYQFFFVKRVYNAVDDLLFAAYFTELKGRHQFQVAAVVFICIYSVPLFVHIFTHFYLKYEHIAVFQRLVYAYYPKMVFPEDIDRIIHVEKHGYQKIQLAQIGIVFLIR